MFLMKPIVYMTKNENASGKQYKYSFIIKSIG